MRVWLGALLSVRLREVSFSGGPAVTNSTTLKLLNSFHFDDNTTGFHMLIFKFEPHTTQQLSFERAIKIHPQKIRAENRTDEAFGAGSEKVTSMTFSLFFFDSTPRA